MTIDGINGITQNSKVESQKPGNIIERLSAKLHVPIENNGKTTVKVTNKDIENALYETSTKNAITGLLSKSPLGLEAQPTKENIENKGYTFYQTAYHIGAPVIYKSPEGGTITVYNGKGDAKSGENERKIIYQDDRYVQEMFYDENGKLVKGSITIKDKVAGFTEERFTFLVENNKITKTIS